METLEKENIDSRPVWKPMHLQPVFKEYDFITAKNDGTSVSEDLFNRGVCLPSDTKMTEEEQEIRGYMENAGIKNGFFTVKMGDREATQFYSATKTTSPIQSKERYDARYKNLTSGGILLDEYEAGDIFKIGDKEYILSENHTLDIPYGEDIYNLEYPSNYKFGKKVE